MKLNEWRSSGFVETTIKGINAKRCAEVIAKLNWIDTQPKPLVSVGEEVAVSKPTVSGFHNRLTVGQHR
jgi:hypothetical protein